MKTNGSRPWTASPLRSLLFVPGWKEKYLAKAEHLEADAFIFDWEESVPPQEKDTARRLTRNALQTGAFATSGKIIRLNHIRSAWFAEDLEACRNLSLDALLLPGVGNPQDAKQALGKIEDVLPQIPVMLLVETATAVVNARAILRVSDRITALVLENNSLSASLKLYPSADREGLLFAMSKILLTARAMKRMAIDGAYLNFTEDETFELHCRQARNLGFDGKTVIHPNQILYANEAFGPTREDIRRAERIVSALAESRASGQAISVLDGHVVEPAEAENAERILAMAAAFDKTKYQTQELK